MTGLVESKRSFENSFDKLFQNHSELKSRVACGLAGPGSQCLGFDDDISRDHDFENGFAVWLDDEDYINYAADLNREYKRLFTRHNEQSIYGIKSIGEFISTTVSKLPEKSLDWLKIPEYDLLNACNGEMFYDKLGKITNIREHIRQCPKDVFLKRASAHMAVASQAGEYNFFRLSERSDIAGASLAIAKFCTHIIHACHALQNKYTPFYKWQFRSMQDIDRDIFSMLNELMLAPKSYSRLDNNIETIRNIARKIARNVQISSDNIGEIAIYIKSRIQDDDIRKLDILYYGA